MNTEQDVSGFLMDAAEAMAECEEIDITITSFRNGGMLTDNEGFTLRVGNPGGPEFQVTIVKSR